MASINIKIQSIWPVVLCAATYCKSCENEQTGKNDKREQRQEKTHIAERHEKICSAIGNQSALTLNLNL